MLFGNVDKLFLDYAQYLALTNYMNILFSKNISDNVKMRANYILWSFFGIFPDKIEFSDDTNTIEDSINYINEHKLLFLFISLLIAFVLTGIASLIYCIIHNTYNKFKKVKTNPFANPIDYVLKFLMVAYFNVTSISMFHLIHSKMWVELFFASILFVTISISFPVLVYYLIFKNSHNLYDSSIKIKYGSLYSKYKKKFKYFTLSIFLKQFFMSFVINIRPQIEYTNNAFLLILHMIFGLYMLHYRPFDRKSYFKESMIISFSSVLVTIINFVFISNIDEEIKIGFFVANVSVQSLAVMGIFYYTIMRLFYEAKPV